MSDDYDDHAPEVHRGPTVTCVFGRIVAADDCQRCWVDGYVLRRGDGVGCETGAERRIANGKDAVRRARFV